MNKFPFREEITPTQEVLVSFPFNVNLSKNKAFATTRNGRFFVRQEHKKAKEELFKTLETECKKYDWKKEKYYLAIHVEKATLRGDCINYLDSIADTLKKVIGIDDNLLEVLQISYEVKRKDPDLKILIYIAQ